MKKIDLHLYDNINREYKRKNLYLLEIANLQEKIENATGGEKTQLAFKLKEVINNKNENLYNKKLQEFKSKEKEFLEILKTKNQTFSKNIDDNVPKAIQKLQLRLILAKEKEIFYKKYVNLTYDAELIYEQSKLEIMQIPQVIDFAKENLKILNDANKAINNLDKSKQEKFEKDFEEFKISQKTKLDKTISKANRKFEDGVISKQAKDNVIKKAKREHKENILVKSFECEKTNNLEIIKNKKYELNKVVKQKISTVDINVADLRRIYPIETEKQSAIISYTTFLFPGLGQALNKQYIKAIILFLATIYTYFLAIPYALGYGNYKGEGVAGLITLAQNAGKLDRSIIFMIEGILSLILVVFAIILMYLSFKDINKVEKDTIKGVRFKTWVETKQTVFEDGFPYLVLSPAMIITVFIVCIPVITTILLSFTGMGPKTQAKFGWEALNNYQTLLMGEGMVGKAFWRILGWTFMWTIGATTVAVSLGFILAIVLNNDRIKGKVLFRSIYLLPWAVPSFITILFFSMLASDKGMLTVALQNIFGANFSIKNDVFVSRIFLICMQSWLGSAYVFLLSTGVLQSINTELYEAADIDGATSFKKLSKITVPLVLFQTAPLLVGQYVFNFNNFGAIYLFNGGGPFDPSKYGNLAGSTDLLISYIYKLTMENQYQSLGAAITIIISLVLMIIAYIGYRNTDAFKRG